MKKIITVLILIFAVNNVYAVDYSLYCKDGSEIKKVSKFAEKFDNITKNVIEFAVSRDLKRQFGSDFKVDLDIFSLKRLKNGEFKKLNVYTDSLQYEGMSVSEFKAASLCTYNRVVYKNGRTYYPEPMPMAFTSKITNKDFENIVNSKEFAEKVLSNGIKVNGHDFLKMLKPKITVENSKVKMILPVKTIFSKNPMNIYLTAGIEVVNNKILLKDITFSKNSNIMVMNVADYFAKNPIAITNSALDSKFCRIYITKAKLDGDVIKSEGIFLINKDYGGSN